MTSKWPPNDLSDLQWPENITLLPNLTWGHVICLFLGFLGCWDDCAYYHTSTENYFYVLTWKYMRREILNWIFGQGDFFLMLQYFILRGAGLLCEKCLRWITFLRWPEILETIIKHLFNHQQKKIKASSLLFSFDTQKI